MVLDMRGNDGIPCYSRCGIILFAVHLLPLDVLNVLVDDCVLHGNAHLQRHIIFALGECLHIKLLDTSRERATHVLDGPNDAIHTRVGEAAEAAQLLDDADLSRWHAGAAAAGVLHDC